jgi:hypothetical protein
MPGTAQKRPRDQEDEYNNDNSDIYMSYAFEEDIQQAQLQDEALQSQEDAFLQNDMEEAIRQDLQAYYHDILMDLEDRDDLFEWEDEPDFHPYWEDEEYNIPFNSGFARLP